MTLTVAVLLDKVESLYTGRDLPIGIISRLSLLKATKKPNRSPYDLSLAKCLFGNRPTGPVFVGLGHSMGSLPPSHEHVKSNRRDHM